MATTENKKALVYSILEFLQKSCEDGTINKDDSEGIEGNHNKQTREKEGVFLKRVHVYF
jgi:hypothetical protein